MIDKVPPAGSTRVSAVVTHRGGRPFWPLPGPVRCLVDGIGAVEGALFTLLAATLWLPAVVNNKAWPPALGLLVLLGGYMVVRQRRLPSVPAVVAVYVAVCVLAAAHGGTLPAVELWRYFAGPLTALAVATIVVGPLQRLRALALVVLFAASQIPITAGQAISGVVAHGRRGADADEVIGTLGSNHAGSLTLVAIVAALVVFAAWLSGALRTRTALPLTAGLVATGAFSATRAAFVFVGIAGVVVVAGLALGAPRPPVRRLVAVGIAPVFAAAGVFGLTYAIYPNAFVKAFSAQDAEVIGKGRHGISRANPTNTLEHPVEGIQLLPGRIAQLRLAVRLSVRDGAAVGGLGRGLGRAELAEPRYSSASAIPLPQRTATTWLGKILTETGWLGVTAFFALLAWLVLVSRRLSHLRNAVTADRVLGIALPGLAALTALGAGYATILAVRGYSTVFWLLVGIAIRAAYDGDPRRQSARARMT